MIARKNSIVYLSAGHISYHKQTLFAVLSLLYYYKDQKDCSFNIVIYTDNIDFFKEKISGNNLVLIHFTEELLASWMKQEIRDKAFHPSDLKAVAKPMCVKSTIQNFGEKAIFIDTDTFFLKNPEQLFNKIDDENTIMFIREGILSDLKFNNWEILRNLFKNNDFTVNGHTYRIPLSTYMWNSGVVGINKQNLHLIDEMINLSLQMLKLSKHKYAYHQIIVSYVLQNNTNIIPVDDIVYHYCYGYEKQNFNKKLISVLKVAEKYSFEERLYYIHGITKEKIPYEKPPDPVHKQIGTFFKKRSIGLKMAFDRVKKTKKIKSFFERGKTY